MVLESIVSPEEVERKPIDMFLLGVIVASVSLWIAYYIFPQGASSWFLFLTTLGVVPLMIRLLFIEETKEEKLQHESIWKRHDEIIYVYLFLFFGMVFAYSFWFTVLPTDVSALIFKDQLAEMNRIQLISQSLAGSTGLVIASGAIIAALAQKFNILEIILLNNLRLLFLFIAFSFLYGTGAILLLTWNASIIAVAIGNLAHETLLIASSSVFNKSIAYFQVLPFSILGFFIHGLFEVLAYFIGAIAGGVLSVAIIRRHYQTPYFKRILADILIMTSTAVFLIFLSGFIEVYITPLL